MADPKLLLQTRLKPTSPTVARVERMQLAAQRPTVKEVRQAPARKTTEKRKGHHPRLTRDQKIVVRTLHTMAKWTYEKIAKQTGHSQRQIELAMVGPLTPQPHKKHPILIRGELL
ncbi:hypothetical protein DL770_011308 [Monosporascus sp. CRB-9-2]|nr:hypothetical protein DL770_011308 [Monosporascus sp. CRB-9-2]